MPFRREQVEALCRLTDEYNARHLVTAEDKRRIGKHVDQIVAANELLAGSGVEQLSDDTATALIVLLIEHVA